MVSLSVQNALLTRISVLLEGVAEYNTAKRAARPSRRKKKVTKDAEIAEVAIAKMEVTDEGGAGPSAEESELVPASAVSRMNETSGN